MEMSGKAAFADVSTSSNARTQWLGREMDRWLIEPRRPRKLSAAYPGAGQRSDFYFREDFEDTWTRHNIDDAIERENDLKDDFPPDSCSRKPIRGVPWRN